MINQKRLQEIRGILPINKVLSTAFVAKSARVTSATAVKYLNILEKHEEVKKYYPRTGQKGFYWKRR